MEQFVEEGLIGSLQDEIYAKGQLVFDLTMNPEPGFFVAEQDFVHLPALQVSATQARFLSAIAGMQPSPDWFTGFTTFYYVDEYTRSYYEHFKIQTFPWDLGTDDGSTYVAMDKENNSEPWRRTKIRITKDNAQRMDRC